MNQQTGLNEVYFGFYRIRSPREHKRLGIGPYLFGPCECGCSDAYGFGCGFFFVGFSVCIWKVRTPAPAVAQSSSVTSDVEEVERVINAAALQVECPTCEAPIGAWCSSAWPGAQVLHETRRVLARTPAEAPSTIGGDESESE